MGFDETKDYKNKRNSYKVKLGPGEISVCSACLKPIEDIYVSAEKKKYHEECLVCFQCGNIIQNQYAVKLTNQGETFFCVEHAYLTTTAILCHDCGGVIRSGSDYFTVKKI